ncbi:MAG: metal ABC transporter ATP-binding protein [Thermotogae bacterium]|nr:metal ABC transporter ATP-binding protein [Thermotogota bacterium]MCP5465751.1 metal ABC transporter ATP-binding protein [Thermotogota bacterium]HOO75597.1 metal ABC transporter ATP-binding protein [Tepiditoga sp.]
MTETIIRAKNVGYETENTLILKNINFEISKKDFVGIIGPNGAGKSTLIKILLGEIEGYTGDVEIRGKIGYVPQHDFIDKTFPISALEVVLMGLYKETGILRRFKKEHINRALEVMKILEIDKLKNRKVGKLSGGEYQRLMLSRALVSGPDILILDEPEAGVDKKGQKLFYNLMKKLNEEQGITVILVSHDISMIFSETNKVMCLNRTLHCHKNTSEMNRDDFKKIYSDSLEMLVHIDEPLKVVSRND